MAVLWFAGRAIADQWRLVHHTGVTLTLRPWPAAGSCALVVAAYALLIETWRRALAASGAPLGFAAAARIWFVSNLGRYVPGKVAQIGAMAVLAERAGVPALVATGSAVLITLVNLLTGAAITLATGASAVEISPAGAAALGAVALAVALAPALLPRAASRLPETLRRRLDGARVPATALWVAIAGTAIAWCLYGLAFRALAVALLGRATGGAFSYVAVFTGSYLAGFLALFAPGGLVVREVVMTAWLTRLGLASAGEAAVLALVSRLWLTVLEITPGALYLFRDVLRRSPASSR